MIDTTIKERNDLIDYIADRLRSRADRVADRADERAGERAAKSGANIALELRRYADNLDVNRLNEWREYVINGGRIPRFSEEC